MAVYKADKPLKNGIIWIFYTRYTDLSGTKRAYKSKKFSTKKEAIEEEKKFNQNLNFNNSNKNMTFKDLYTHYYSYQKDKVKVTIQKSYRDRVKYLKFCFYKLFCNLKYFLCKIKNKIDIINASSRTLNVGTSSSITVTGAASTNYDSISKIYAATVQQATSYVYWSRGTTTSSSTSKSATATTYPSGAVSTYTNFPLYRPFVRTTLNGSTVQKHEVSIYFNSKLTCYGADV